MPASVDVGEQIFGSSHSFEVPAPWNLGPGAAVVTAELSDNPAFKVDRVPAILQESGRMTSGELEAQLQSAIKVRFSPVADGEYPTRVFAADLSIQMRWTDGAIERRVIHLRGRGRSLEDRPEMSSAKDQSPISKPSAPPPVPVTQGPYNEADRTSLDAAFHAANIQAAAIARSQTFAVNAVKEEAGSYVPPSVKRSIWWDIAEAAVTLGTGVVAGTVGKLLAETIVEGVAGTAYKSVVDSIAGAMKDGMTRGAKAAVHSLSSDSTYDVSSDKKIAFFEMQEDALNSLETSNEQLVNERHAQLTPLLGSEPQLAIHAMNAIAQVLFGQRKLANDAQKNATAAAWVGFRARMSLGTEALPTREHEPVTDLANARPKHPGPDLASIKGLLDLDIDIEHGAPYVAAARVNGVASSLANELMANPLANSRMPLRLVVSRNEQEPTIITRDEAGRVRVSGNLQRLSRFVGGETIADEPQAELAARRLVDEIVARPLVPKTGTIDTDDQHEKSS
jgi:hypothetical protein